MPRIIAAILMILTASQAEAQDFTARAVLQSGLSDAGRAYVLGMGRGFEVANSVLRQAGKAPIYCAAEGTALGPGDYLDMIRDFSARDEALLDNPFDAVLISALAAKFPCR